MKLKKVISLCHQRKTFRLFDKISENGEIVQWMGDGCAAYPLNGLPILDEETLRKHADDQGNVENRR